MDEAMPTSKEKTTFLEAIAKAMVMRGGTTHSQPTGEGSNLVLQDDAQLNCGVDDAFHALPANASTLWRGGKSIEYSIAD